MDEDFKARLLQAMDGMINTAGDIKDFAIEEAPKVVQDYVAWGFWEGLITAICALLYCVVAGILAKKLFNYYSNAPLEGEYYKSKTEAAIGSCIAACFLTGSILLVFGTGVVPNILQSCKAYVAPRAYMIDKVLQMRSGK